MIKIRHFEPREKKFIQYALNYSFLPENILEEECINFGKDTVNKIISQSKIKIIISDNNSRSLKIKKSLLKILKKSKLKRSNTIIVIGGDGFMLQTLKKNKKSKKLFYGVNSGNYGFLMNKFSSKNFIKNFIRSKKVSISPLEMKVKNNKNRSNAHSVKEIRS